MKKGQAAFEFLSTYAWVIIVVLATITALSYFGILDPFGFLPQYYNLNDGFTAGQYKAAEDGIYLQFHNSLGETLTEYNFTIDPKGKFICTDNYYYNDSVMGGSTSSPIFKLCSNHNLKVGDRVKADIIIDYVKKDEQVHHQAFGNINLRIEE